MKITKVEVLKVKTTRATWRPVFCRIYTDEGIYGDGEAALAYGRAADAGFAAVKEFASLIIGMDPLKNEVIWEKLYKSTFLGTERRTGNLRGNRSDRHCTVGYQGQVLQRSDSCAAGRSEKRQASFLC